MNKYIQPFEYMGVPIAVHFGSFETMINLSAICKLLGIDIKSIMSNETIRHMISFEASQPFSRVYRTIKSKDEIENGTYTSFIIAHMCLNVDLEKVVKFSDFIKWMNELHFSIRNGLIIPRYVIGFNLKHDAEMKDVLTLEEYFDWKSMSKEVKIYRYEQRLSNYLRLTGKDIYGGNDPAAMFGAGSRGEFPS